VDWIPVTSVPRTLLDLAEVSNAKGVRRAYEEAARLELLDVRAVERVLARARGRRGFTPLRDLLGYDPTPATRTRSELERLFLDRVRDGGIPSPAVNVLVEGFSSTRTGRRPGSSSNSTATSTTAAARPSSAITRSSGGCGSRGMRSCR
jgi:hypothetical protein